MITILHHPECEKHSMGVHPECPERLQVISKNLREQNFTKWQEAPLASRDLLSLAHDPSYVDSIFASSPASGFSSLDPDTKMNPFTLQAALRAAGSLIQAVDLVQKKETQRVFCNIRPPGHHAERNTAMGFCFFSNLAVGVRYAIKHYGLKRILIVDFDAHHGNGTEDILQDDPEILFCSLFQHPFYPNSPLRQNHPRLLHMPLAAGSTGETMRQKFKELWYEAIHKFAPELIFFSAGFDAHRQDPLAELAFIEEDYFWLTEAVLEASGPCPVISALEGGYALEVLGPSVLRHLQALSK